MNIRSTFFLFASSFFLMTSCNFSKKAGLTKKSDSDVVVPVKVSQADFFAAAFQGNIADVQAGIKDSIDVNAIDPQGASALSLASYNGHKDIVSLLINNGAVVNVCDTAGRTPLMFASSGNFPETVEILLKNGAKINEIDKKDNFTALMFAGNEGQLDVIKVLLKYHADPKMKDKAGNTAYSFAKLNNQPGVAAFLEPYMK